MTSTIPTFAPCTSKELKEDKPGVRRRKSRGLSLTGHLPSCPACKYCAGSVIMRCHCWSRRCGLERESNSNNDGWLVKVCRAKDIIAWTQLRITTPPLRRDYPRSSRNADAMIAGSLKLARPCDRPRGPCYLMECLATLPLSLGRSLIHVHLVPRGSVCPYSVPNPGATPKGIAQVKRRKKGCFSADSRGSWCPCLTKESRVFDDITALEAGLPVETAGGGRREEGRGWRKCDWDTRI